MIRTLAPFLGLLTLTTLAEEKPRAEFWLDLHMGEPIEQEADLWDDLTSADVVFVGETHRLARHHRIQVVVAEKLLATKRPFLLGLEQIEARHQAVLDRYAKGAIDFDELAKTIDWKAEWDNYEDYRALLETVRERNGRVVGLNGPREVIHQTGKVGIAALEPAQRSLLPDKIHTDDPVYERLLNLLLSVHSTFDPKFLKNVFEAQVARDDSMAAHLVAALGPVPAKDQPRPVAMTVTGSGHIQFGLGTPDRVKWRRPDLEPRIVLCSESGDLVLSPMEEAMRRAVQIHHRDIRFIGRPVGDYLHVKEQNPKAPGR
jgi:uncharacterized iron-regulated protein